MEKGRNRKGSEYREARGKTQGVDLFFSRCFRAVKRRWQEPCDLPWALCLGKKFLDPNRGEDVEQGAYGCEHRRKV